MRTASLRTEIAMDVSTQGTGVSVRDSILSEEDLVALDGAIGASEAAALYPPIANGVTQSTDFQ